MFSDNENPGAEVPADNPLQPPHRRQKQSLQLYPTEETLSTSAEAQNMTVAAPVSRSRPPSTVLLPNLLRHRDGAAAVEHSRHECRGRIRGAIHRINRRDGTAHGAVRRAASRPPQRAKSSPAGGSGDPTCRVSCGFGRKNRGTDSARKFAELDGAIPLQPDSISPLRLA